MNRRKPYKSNKIRPLFLWPICDTPFGFLNFWFGFLPLCSSFPPFAGCYVEWSLPGFHNKTPNANKRKTTVWCISSGFFFYCVRDNRNTLWYGFEISIQTIPQTSASPKNPSFPLTLELEKIFLKIEWSPWAPLWLDWYTFATYLKLTSHQHE